MKPVFVGSHPAIDFLNTWLAPGGAPAELIGDGEAFVGWLVAAGLLDRPLAARLTRRFGGAALDDAAAEARRFREWLRGWIPRWQERPDDLDAAELRRLNAILARATFHREVVVTAGARALVERGAIDAADRPLALVALEVAKLVTREDPALIKRCAGPDCTLSFLDRTRARHRVFCSAAACGNRAKVAAFRARQRDAH